MDGMPLCEATKHIVQVVVATCNYEIIMPYLQDLIFTHFANENKTQTFRFWCIKDTANQSQSKMQISGPPFCMIYLYGRGIARSSKAACVAIAFHIYKGKPVKCIYERHLIHTKQVHSV